MNNMTGAMALLVFSILLMLYMTYRSYKNQQNAGSMEGYFLGNRGVGTIVLAFSLLATQYSGNSMIGYTAKVYRSGFGQLVYPVFMVAIVVGYMLFIPRLYVLAKKNRYITVVDYLQDRYHSKTICLLSALFLFWGIFVQFLEQLQATGTLFSGLNPNIPYWVGVVFLSIFLAAYVAIGGMKGTMLIQALQGMIMLIGLIFLVVMGWSTFGSFEESVHKLMATEPAKVLAPQTGKSIMQWASTLVLVGLGAALYAHSIQQFFAAKDESVVKRSLARMTVLTFVTPMILFVIGIIAAAAFPGLNTMDSEKVIPQMIAKIMATSSAAYWMMAITLIAIIMATLSTASGVLITITTMLIKDFYEGFINPHADENKSIRFARVLNFIILGICIVLVLEPQTTIWRLTEIKFEGILQAAPPLLLGLYWARAEKKAVILGMLAGAGLAIWMSLSGHKMYLGVHGGVWGMLLNFVISVLLSCFWGASEAEIISNKKRFISLFQ